MSLGRSLLRPLVGAVVVGALVWHAGIASVLAALRGIDGRSVAAVAGLAAATTVGGAWRWVLVARGLGLELSLRSAVTESYRSQFLNLSLPGGVVGDVTRGVRHGRDTGQLGRGVRSVVWERAAGQAVLAVLTAAALLVLPSPWTPTPTPTSTPTSFAGAWALVVPGLVVLAIVAVAAFLVVSRDRAPHREHPPRPCVQPEGAPKTWATRVRLAARVAAGDVRSGLLARRTWPGVVVASALVVMGHVVTVLVAARAAGVTAPVTRLVPLALVVLVAMAVPLNIAGWGPREGAAAWAFGAAGLGATAGLSTALVYGVLTFLATLPGAALLLVAHRPVRTASASPPARRVITLEGASRG